MTKIYTDPNFNIKNFIYYVTDDIERYHYTIFHASFFLCLIPRNIKEEILSRFTRENKTAFGSILNVNQEFFEGLPNASSLFLKTGYEIEIGDVLKRVLKFFEVYFNILSGEDPTRLKVLYEAWLFQKGKPSIFRDEKEKFHGAIKGVTETGLLMIQKKSGRIFNYSHGSIEFFF